MQLKPRARKVVLTTHVMAASAWIGIDVVVACLVFVGETANDPQTRGLAYQALSEFIVAPMFVSAVACLATGLALGLATKWGLVRYWWVSVKLVMNVVLAVLILVALRPGMGDARTHGDALVAGGDPTGDMTGLIFPPAVSLSVLTVAVILAIFKPWGKLRGQGGRRQVEKRKGERDRLALLHRRAEPARSAVPR